MTDTHPRHQDDPAPARVLAAVRRAGDHHPRGAPVGLRSVLEHLDVAPRSRRARAVRAALGELSADGLLAQSRRRGAPAWALSAGGRERAAREAAAVELPESPQHRAWRNARTAAAQEIGRFRADLRALLDAAGVQLDERTPPHSDAWLALGERLQHACWRVGSATHCLSEWPEPRDEAADVDDHSEAGDARLAEPQRARARARRSGRRNVRLWADG
jgi:ribosomal protein L12E/L44/L45/RPP1/RPP2